MKRVATALVLAPLITYFILWSPHPAFVLVLAVLGSFCFHEFRGIAAGFGIDLPFVPGLIAGIVFLSAPPSAGLAVLLGVISLLLGLSALDLKSSLPRAAAFALGVLYSFGCWQAAIELRKIDPRWLFLAVALNWVGDTFAMLIGKAFGRHKLWPRISPAKSWEGAVASLVSAVLFAAALGFWAFREAPLWLVISAAALGNIAGQIGDLAESALKRGAGLKDSGTLLPGHGGWLDRVDSTLFSMPVVLAILEIAASFGPRLFDRGIIAP